MGKKGKIRGKPFVKTTDDRRNVMGRADTGFEGQGELLIRENKSVYQRVSSNSFEGGVPPGAHLRPKEDEGSLIPTSSLSNTQNFIIDDGKLLEATNQALYDHKLHAPNHTPVWKKLQFMRIGFGAKMRFRCNFKNCHYESKLYELYEKTDSGQLTTNLQVGVAMSKTDLTPKTVELLGSTLNLATPTVRHLQKSYTRALSCTDTLAEEALADNREEVTATMRLNGLCNKDIPSVDVATDGHVGYYQS